MFTWRLVIQGHSRGKQIDKRRATWGGKEGKKRVTEEERENREPGAECCDTGCRSLAALMWRTDVNHIQPSGSCQCLFSVTQSDTSCLRCHLSARPPVGVGRGGGVCVCVCVCVCVRGQWWHTAVLMTHKPGPEAPQLDLLLVSVAELSKFHHLGGW